MRTFAHILDSRENGNASGKQGQGEGGDPVAGGNVRGGVGGDGDRVQQPGVPCPGGAAGGVCHRRVAA